MTGSAHLPFAELNGALKAAGEATRLRILALLGEAELTVSELTDILRQSQPRISRHLRLLAEAGLIERFREGSWAFFRLGEQGGAAALARDLIGRLDPADAMLLRDRERLTAVRSARAAAAQAYFRRHAAEWDRIRKLHVADEAVEEAIRAALAGTDVPLVARSRHRHRPHAGAVRPVDRARRSASTCRSTCCRSPAPISTVRALRALQRPAGRHLRPRAADAIQLRPRHHPPGAALPRRSGARASHEAARVLRPGGRLLVVDFAPHELEFLRDEHAHRRLGFAPETDDAAGWRLPASTWCARNLAPEPAPTARSPCRSGSAAIRRIAGRAARCDARWRDERRPATRQPLHAAPGEGAPIRVSFEFFPPKTEEMEQTLWESITRLAPLDPALRVGHLWRRRLDARAHARDRQAHPRRNRAEPAAHLTCVGATATRSTT